MGLSQSERAKLSSDQLVALAKDDVILSAADRNRLSRSQLLIVHSSGQDLSEDDRTRLSSSQLLDLAARGEVLTGQERENLSRDQLLKLREIGQSLTPEDRARLSSDQLVKLRKTEEEQPISYRGEMPVQLDSRILDNAVSTIQSSSGLHCWQAKAIAAHLGYSVNQFNGADFEELLERVGKDPAEAKPAIKKAQYRGLLREKEIAGIGRILYMDPAEKELYEARFAAFLSGDVTEIPSRELIMGNLKLIDTKDVFVVHGRNEVARQAMFTFLRAIGLHPLEWNEIVEMTGKGSPYIGEILEEGFSRAQAAVILMTPDDEARLREPLRGNAEPPHETDLTPQPRPNVLIEAGMALGLFPNRTIIVELGRLRPVSDLFGRHVIRIDNTLQRRQELAQRLATAGCSVNLSGTDWHAEGDFEGCIDSLTSVCGPHPRFLDYFDGLSGDELYRLAVAVQTNSQTVSCGRNDSVAATLVSKGLLERVPFDSDLNMSEFLHTIPTEVWRHLLKETEWLFERTVKLNEDRPDRLGQLTGKGK